MGRKKPEHPKEPAGDGNWGPFYFSLNGHSLSGKSSTMDQKVSRLFLNFFEGGLEKSKKSFKKIVLDTFLLRE
jgi:hypothetical protein